MLRLIPVEAVCKANLKDILTAAGTLFDKYFLKGGKTFSIIYNKRYNNSIKRDEIIKELAELVALKNCNNKVNLKEPELSVIVEVIKGLCCLSVVEEYIQFKKYNLIEIVNAKDDQKVDQENIKDEMKDQENSSGKEENSDEGKA